MYAAQYLTSTEKAKIMLPKEAEFSLQVARGRKIGKRIWRERERDGLSRGRSKVLRN